MFPGPGVFPYYPWAQAILNPSPHKISVTGGRRIGIRTKVDLSLPQSPLLLPSCVSRLLVRVYLLFMSSCCYPTIPCGFTRPRLPSRETRVNGMQLQPNTGNWYSMRLLPHSSAKPSHRWPQRPQCTLVPGHSMSREHQLQHIMTQEEGCQRKGGKRNMEELERDRGGTDSLRHL